MTQVTAEFNGLSEVTGSWNMEPEEETKRRAGGGNR